MALKYSLAAGALAYLSYYVHKRCFTALDANSTDHTVLTQQPLTQSSPSPSPSSSPDANQQTSLVEPLSKPLLVVVLGWGGSTRKQLRRIIEFITNTLECPVVSYISPMIRFLYGSLDEHAVESILEQISRQVSKNNPSGPEGFVFLVHSNNGAFVYGELKTRLQDPANPYHHLLPKLRGVIFDSAPALYELSSSSSLATPTAPKRPNLLIRMWNVIVGSFWFSFPNVAIVTRRPMYVHPFWTPAITLWSIAFSFVLFLKEKFGGQTAKDGNKATGLSATRDTLRYQLKKDVLQVPHLFLYSQGDRLLSSNYITSYTSYLRSTYPDLDVICHDFKTTGHVQHFLKETTIYADKLREFLQTLSNKSKPTMTK